MEIKSENVNKMKILMLSILARYLATHINPKCNSNRISLLALGNQDQKARQNSNLITILASRA